MQQITNINDFVRKIVGIGNVAVYFLIGLAVIFIVWNIVIYMVKPADPKVRGDALKSAGWGILGLAIIVSIWGLVNFLSSSFPTNNNMPTDRFPNANFVNSK